MVSLTMTSPLLCAMRLTVSVIPRPGIQASAPSRMAPTTAANSAGDASGRAASWTTMISASPHALSPARTDSARVAPPVTTMSAPCLSSV